MGAFPDLETTLEVDLSSGEKVVTRWIARGTHTGEVTTLANLQVVDGKISEEVRQGGLRPAAGRLNGLHAASRGCTLFTKNSI